jgi:hypothetical protein
MLLKMATFLEIARKQLLSPATRQVHSGGLTFSNQSFSACATQLVKQLSQKKINFRLGYLPFRGVARLSAVWAKATSLAVMPPASCVTSDTFTLL